MREIWEEYMEYLLDSIGFYNDDWRSVLLYLHFTPFKVLIERDENRVNDAIYERMAFFRDTHDVYFDDHTASVLEVLIYFIKRITDEYIPHYNYDGENMQYVIFEAFLRNLGLRPYENGVNLEDKVDFWLDRKYKNDGKGSIMPLNDVYYDYKNTEIWNQFFIFLSDHKIKSWEDFEDFL